LHKIATKLAVAQENFVLDLAGEYDLDREEERIYPSNPIFLIVFFASINLTCGVNLASFFK
jgi:hypothetical protein